MSVRRAEENLATATRHGTLTGPAIEIKMVRGLQPPKSKGIGGSGPRSGPSGPSGGGLRAGPVKRLNPIYETVEYSQLLGEQFDPWINAMQDWGDLCRLLDTPATSEQLIQRDANITRIVDLWAAYEALDFSGASDPDSIDSFMNITNRHLHDRYDAIVLRAAIEEQTYKYELEEALYEAKEALDISNPYL